jgi:hypothetical protein
LSFFKKKKNLEGYLLVTMRKNDFEMVLQWRKEGENNEGSSVGKIQRLPLPGCTVIRYLKKFGVSETAPSAATHGHIVDFKSRVGSFEQR